MVSLWGFSQLVVYVHVRGYAEMIERRLKSSALLSEHEIANDEKLLPKAVEDATRRGLLYAVILKEQNELHHSLTLNILHGTPQGRVQALSHVYDILHPFVHRNPSIKLYMFTDISRNHHEPCNIFWSYDIFLLHFCVAYIDSEYTFCSF